MLPEYCTRCKLYWTNFFSIMVLSDIASHFGGAFDFDRTVHLIKFYVCFWRKSCNVNCFQENRRTVCFLLIHFWMENERSSSPNHVHIHVFLVSLLETIEEGVVLCYYFVYSIWNNSSCGYTWRKMLMKSEKHTNSEPQTIK